MTPRLEAESAATAAVKNDKMSIIGSFYSIKGKEMWVSDTGSIKKEAVNCGIRRWAPSDLQDPVSDTV